MAVCSDPGCAAECWSDAEIHGSFSSRGTACLPLCAALVLRNADLWHLVFLAHHSQPQKYDMEYHSSINIKALMLELGVSPVKWEPTASGGERKHFSGGTSLHYEVSAISPLQQGLLTLCSARALLLLPCLAAQHRAEHSSARQLTDLHPDDAMAAAVC